MIIISLTGGLGNQMFQYSFARNLSKKHKSPLKYHFTNALLNTQREFSLNIFNLDISEAKSADLKKLGVITNPILNRVFYLLDERLGLRVNKKIYTERVGYEFDKNILALPDNMYVQGFFQNELYFKSIESTIQKDFHFPKLSNKKNIKIAANMKRATSVAIHVRRTDYVANDTYQGFASEDYYKNAINYISKKVKNPEFYVFSDDISWCRENIKTKQKIHFIDWNTGDKSYIDMQLMSMCTHNIIANSSFSFWGAWLNNSKDKLTIAPEYWVKDVKSKTLSKSLITLK